MSFGGAEFGDQVVAMVKQYVGQRDAELKAELAEVRERLAFLEGSQGH